MAVPVKDDDESRSVSLRVLTTCLPLPAAVLAWVTGRHGAILE